ncbi:MAG: hypothetical protein HYW15_02865 [Candidatus Giovannonibacteria bacterium]|nr:MAG: hypothetical protein HYW15_02865 [Candidatus Giovannonibacteria bacterium]
MKKSLRFLLVPVSILVVFGVVFGAIWTGITLTGRRAYAAQENCEKLYQEAQKALELSKSPHISHNTHRIADGISKGLEYIRCLDKLIKR